MDAGINAAVKQCPLLSLDVHEDGLHKIRRRGMGRGSLWIRIKASGYTVCLSGVEMIEALGDFLRSQYGPPTSIIQGREYWKNISHIGDVSKIIHRFGEG